MRVLLLLLGCGLAVAGALILWRLHLRTGDALSRGVLAVSPGHREEAERWRLAGIGGIAGGVVLVGLGLLRRRR